MHGELIWIKNCMTKTKNNLIVYFNHRHGNDDTCRGNDHTYESHLIDPHAD